jgi:hypothetical protein
MQNYLRSSATACDNGETPPPEFVLIDELIGGLQFLASG